MPQNLPRPVLIQFERQRLLHPGSYLICRRSLTDREQQ